MQCITCKVEIPPTFKHAVAKNECPSCGGQILDEESLALIEDVERTISGEISLREGTANRLAIALVTRYDMVMKTGLLPAALPFVPPVPAQSFVPPTRQRSQENVKIAPPSMMQQVAAGESIMQQSTGANIVKVPDLPENISEDEREQIMAEVVSKRYGMVEGIASSDVGFEEEDRKSVV